ncbi:unnamed protein product [Caenorhabditis angaria]|uniref:Uncharacterized protein n=1 Tax=Caenorhabditis angaria TaxID=860376 RepID=A0A9P1J1E7_9PELO|nr:unnamed protein product [Caenorhabditis angaria]
MPSKNCTHNLHACEWERDILIAFVVLFAMLNLFQLGWKYRTTIFRNIRRAADNIPNENVADHERLYNAAD